MYKIIYSLHENFLFFQGLLQQKEHEEAKRREYEAKKRQALEEFEFRVKEKQKQEKLRNLK